MRRISLAPCVKGGVTAGDGGVCKNRGILRNQNFSEWQVFIILITLPCGEFFGAKFAFGFTDYNCGILLNNLIVVLCTFLREKYQKRGALRFAPHPPAQEVRGTLTCAHTLRFAQARSVFLRKPPSDASRRLLSEGARPPKQPPYNPLNYTLNYLLWGVFLIKSIKSAT